MQWEFYHSVRKEVTDVFAVNKENVRCFYVAKCSKNSQIVVKTPY